MSNELRDKLLAARARIEAGWCKGALQDGKEFCAAGALLPIGSGGRVVMPGFGEDPAHAALRAALPKQWNHGDYTDLAKFNDHRLTTREDVLALYDRAIASAGDEP